MLLPAPGAQGQAWGGRGGRAVAAVSLDGTPVLSTHFTRNKKQKKRPKKKNKPQKTNPLKPNQPTKKSQPNNPQVWTVPK